MEIYKIKFVKSLLGINRKALMCLMRDRNWITASNAILNDSGYVVELHDHKDGCVETTLFITNKGIELLKKEVSDAI